MNEITFNVARSGEGKTRWLLDVAHKYKDSGRKVYYCTSSELGFARFCEKYFLMFCTASNVDPLNLTHLTKDDVVLIDDLIGVNFSTEEIRYIQSHCYKLYVTLNGIYSNKEKLQNE